MAKELERKFLVKNENWRRSAGGKQCRQGYVNLNQDRTLRVRTASDKGFVTVKGTGATRAQT
jgi:adenylate cyclase